MAPSFQSIVIDSKALLGIPEKPLLREIQLKEIQACFSGDVAKVSPIHAWVYGPPGVGKTLCVRYLLLKALPAGFLSVFINCRERLTFLAVVESILDVVKPLRSPHRTREHQLSILKSTLVDRHAVIVFDEVDTLHQKDLTDLLHHLCSFPKLSLINIASSRQPLLKLPETVKSRLTPRHILFPRYQPEEMMVILKHAAMQGLKSGAWTPEVLQKITDHSYGDARRAIALLRHGVQRAEEGGASQLTSEHLKVSSFDQLQPLIEDQLDSMTTHHRLLYELASSKGPIPGTGLEEGYRKACEHQGVPALSSRSVKNYLDTLCQQRLLSREHGPETPGWIYRVVESA